MTTKPLKIATHIIFMSRQINLNARNFKIISYNQEKCKLNMIRYFYRSVYIENVPDVIVIVNIISKDCNRISVLH